MAIIETAVIELEKGKLGLGFNILGGTDAPHLPGNDGIFVAKIIGGGTVDLDGRLQKGDKIVEINGESVAGLTHGEVVNKFRQTGNKVILKVLHGEEQRLLREKALAENAKTPYSHDSTSNQNSSSLYWLGTALAVGGIAALVSWRYLKTSS